MSPRPSNGPRGGLFPRSLDQCVEKLTKKALKDKGAAETRLITHWPQIAGPTLAQVSQPQKVTFHRDGSGATLQLLVHAGWALEFQHQEPVLLERVAAFFGYPAVARITIKQGYIEQPAKEKSTTLVSRQVELTGDMKLSLDEIEDPELRAALDRLGQAVAHRLQPNKT